MPRSKQLRKIVSPPEFESFKPHGEHVSANTPVELLYEEYEAIKLADYEFMNHKEASVLMGISRPTFARIYESARRKIAKAFVEIRPIKTIFGNAWMESGWLNCKQCFTKFTIPVTMRKKECPLCSSHLIELINE